ncbi:hypothetical protein AMEX_G23900 [Astyanax mexicanus]|uniref:Uncharacterized protein n=1 Tax=Astyanax mexicanus TaxID=7994 RepID=A0A8T2KWB1_ASTMX|nr:hypothetical protein AMEX_G23900 [Astyanax mexicanus]
MCHVIRSVCCVMEWCVLGIVVVTVGIADRAGCGRLRRAFSTRHDIISLQLDEVYLQILTRTEAQAD